MLTEQYLLRLIPAEHLLGKHDYFYFDTPTARSERATRHGCDALLIAGVDENPAKVFEAQNDDAVEVRHHLYHVSFGSLFWNVSDAH